MHRRFRGEVFGVLNQKPPGGLLCLRFGVAALTEACYRFSRSLIRIPFQYLEVCVPNAASRAPPDQYLMIALSRFGNAPP